MKITSPKLKEIRPVICAFLIGILVSACHSVNSDDVATTPSVGGVETAPLINYAVLATYPHDSTSFTEGLLFHKGKLFESTGSPESIPVTRSLVGEVDLQTGRINPRIELDRKKYFGEGISFLGNKLFQLTYTVNQGFVYDETTYKQIGEFKFPGREGWGMTTDSTHLIMSDGTHQLFYIDPTTLKTVKTLEVSWNNVLVDSLNELEFVKGYIYANRYTHNYILKIDTTTGKVLGRIDLNSLVMEATNQYPLSLELNGIAYDPTQDRFFVTGKLWPHIYAISFVH